MNIPSGGSAQAELFKEILEKKEDEIALERTQAQDAIRMCEEAILCRDEMELLKNELVTRSRALELEVMTLREDLASAPKQGSGQSDYQEVFKLRSENNKLDHELTRLTQERDDQNAKMTQIITETMHARQIEEEMRECVKREHIANSKIEDLTHQMHGYESIYEHTTWYEQQLQALLSEMQEEIGHSNAKQRKSEFERLKKKLDETFNITKTWRDDNASLNKQVAVYKTMVTKLKAGITPRNPNDVCALGVNLSKLSTDDRRIVELRLLNEQKCESEMNQFLHLLSKLRACPDFKVLEANLRDNDREVLDRLTDVLPVVAEFADPSQQQQYFTAAHAA